MVAGCGFRDYLQVPEELYEKVGLLHLETGASQKALTQIQGRIIFIAEWQDLA